MYKDDADAQYERGMKFYKNKNYIQAKACFEKAAVQGDADAQVCLGNLYYDGEGVPQNKFTAKAWYEKAAAQGNSKAQDLLVQVNFVLKHEHLLRKDEEETEQYGSTPMFKNQSTRKSTPMYANLESETPETQYQRGMHFYSNRNYVQAKTCFEKAAAQRHAGAQSRLGDMYYNAHGVPKNYPRAKEWYEKAADQGDAPAQHQIGTLYYEGNGVPQDYSTAKKWFEKAAAQGDAPAQHWLESVNSILQSKQNVQTQTRRERQERKEPRHTHNYFPNGYPQKIPSRYVTVHGQTYGGMYATEEGIQRAIDFDAERYPAPTVELAPPAQEHKGHYEHRPFTQEDRDEQLGSGWLTGENSVWVDD
jgi:TPR repeat protein